MADEPTKKCLVCDLIEALHGEEDAVPLAFASGFATALLGGLAQGARAVIDDNACDAHKQLVHTVVLGSLEKAVR